MEKNSKPIQCVIKHHLVTIRTNNSGWTREVNVVSWEGSPAKLDIRDWSRDKSRSGKGLTFTRKEAERLRNILSIISLDIIEEGNETVQNVSTTFEQPLTDKPENKAEEIKAGTNTEESSAVLPSDANEAEECETPDELKEAV